MRFTLYLQILGNLRVLPINYQYPLHSWIYRTLQQAHADFSRFLHDEGYTVGHRTFKLFTFSPLRGEPYRIFRGEQRIGFYGSEVRLGVSFWLPEAAEHFIRGLFMGQQFRLGDRISQVHLEVIRIEAQSRPLFTETMRYRTLTPVVVSAHVPGHKHAQYLPPDYPTYAERLLNNLLHKAEAVKLNVPTKEVARASVADISDKGPARLSEGWEFATLGTFRKKGITIKQHTPQQNKIIGYTYDLVLRAPPTIQQLAYYAGLGEDNSMGFGYLEARAEKLKTETGMPAR